MLLNWSNWKRALTNFMLPSLKILFFLNLILLLSPLGAQKSFVENAGDISQIILPLTAGASTIFYKDGLKPGLQYGKSILSAVVFTHILKRLIDKKRPDGGSHSFPSGHTAAAFSGAAFFHKRYGIEYGIPAYLLATFVGWSRVDASKHDWVDVGFGAAIGISSSFIFTKKYQINNNTIELEVSLNSIGLIMQF